MDAASRTLEGITAMTKEEAIKHLHTYSSTNGSGLTTQDQHEEAKKMAIKALEQPEQRWIPISEGLPEEDGDYLVTFERGYRDDYGLDPIGIAPFEVDCEGFGIWQENFHPVSLGSLGSEWVDIRVTAWRPLPEPYRSEGEEHGET